MTTCQLVLWILLIKLTPLVTTGKRTLAPPAFHNRPSRGLRHRVPLRARPVQAALGRSPPGARALRRDWRTALAEVVNAEARDLTVFIHTAGTPTQDQVTFLRQYGVDDASADRQIFTATLSARVVQELTQQPWIRYIRLASQLRPVGEAPGLSGKKAW